MCVKRIKKDGLFYNYLEIRNVFGYAHIIGLASP